MEQEFSIPKLSVSNLNFDSDVIIDVRSPKEFEEFSFPISVNIAIFNNDERAKIGTIYTQVSREAAIKEGLVSLSDKLPRIHETVFNLKKQFPGKKLVITCARGGMRSSSVVSMLNMLGIHCYQLEGGIRSYRESTVESLESYTKIEKRVYIVSGNTGTRKTEILKILKKEGYPVLDFEGLARHRGSVFGGIGLKARSQKQFEALLVEELERYKDFPYYIMESESKRVGNITIPNYFMIGKENGIRIELEYPMEKRIDHLLETYQPKLNHEELVAAFQKIKKRFQGHIANEIEDFFSNQQYDKAFSLLLTHYYDPMYTHATSGYNQQYSLINFTHIDEAVNGIKDAINENE